MADAIEKFGDLGNLPQSAKIAADFADFEPELYNVWTWVKKADGRTDHPGNSDRRILENLLYAYTEPFDVVVDPFAGGGSTIDVCAKRARRYYFSDIKPCVARESEIHQHDITSGMPRVPRWQDVAPVYLDPPRWKPDKGRYGDEPENLANMKLDDFHDALYGVISGFAAKLRSGTKIALLIQPTQWNAPEHRFTDHAVEMQRRVKMPAVQRYQCPYPTQQADAQMVQWAKDTRSSLVISRELIIWEKD